VGVVASAPQSLDQIKTVLVNIPAGPFKMGTNLTETTRALQDCTDRDKATRCDPVDVQDSFPEHDVLINQFTLEKYEVNTEQYVAFLNSLGPNSHKAGCGGQPCAATENEQQFSHIAFDSLRYTVTSAIYANRPINYVTWYGADAYCRAIGRRLPSEAEWEYAGRYPDGRIYPWGNFWEPTRALTSRPANEGGAREVNDFTTGRSQLELFNMSGNVSEWVNDWYDANSYANTPQNAVNPQGPPGGTTKVIRGGDWDAIPLYARLPHRRDAEPTTVTISIGFRCAADGGAATSNTSPLTAGS
jgi:formylglycine-generating enzyme required for sulfatase activity